jgi:hypothetical protein
LVLENTSMTFWLKTSIELINCPAVDSTAKAFSLPRPMALHKTIFTWLDVGKQLPFSTLVTGIVSTVFRSLTVSENYCFEVVPVTKQWHSVLFIDLDMNIRFLILLSVYVF